MHVEQTFTFCKLLLVSLTTESNLAFQSVMLTIVLYPGISRNKQISANKEGKITIAKDIGYCQLKTRLLGSLPQMRLTKELDS